MSAPPDLPDVVSRAFAVSRKHGYVSFCRNETGRLLAALAASRTGTLAEFGTGTGVGTAWLRSGIRDGSNILTAELDPKLAHAAATIFTDDDRVEVVAADWSTLRDRGPFSLLFLDAREPKDSGADTIIDLVEPGGEDVGGQPHLQLVVMAHAPHQPGHRLSTQGLVP
jgi:predicted O-methyltransferase YrrM